MLKCYFFGLLDKLTETVVHIFYARNLEHAKAIVTQSIKNSSFAYDECYLKNLELVCLSDLIAFDNDFDSIHNGTCDSEFISVMDFYFIEDKPVFEESDK